MAAQQEDSNRLMVIWSSADREVATKMVFMYTRNAKLRGWWQDVTLVVWGPSARALVEDEELQAGLAAVKEAGVELLACKACSDMYGDSDRLEKLGVQVVYMGEPLTRFLKAGHRVLTF